MEAHLASGEGASSPAPVSRADADTGAGSEGREGGNCRPGPTPGAISSLPPPTPVAGQGPGGGSEQFAPSLPPSPLPLPELFAQVRAVGGRLVRRGGVVSVEADTLTPEMEAASRRTKAICCCWCRSQTPRPRASGGSSTSPTPSTARIRRGRKGMPPPRCCRREQEEAQRKGGEEIDPAFMAQLDALQPETKDGQG